MKRVVLFVTVGVLVIAAAVYSRQQTGEKTAEVGKASEMKIATEAKNPWTNLKLNNDPEQFQFVVVTDRTGGHRDKIFSRAVHQINLLQPEFVISVGDLIEGYTTKDEVITNEWDQFNGFVSKLEMPFFYVPGNHDLTNKELVEAWGGRFGRKYYHFVYRNVLFLATNSEDPVSKVSDEQNAYFKKAIDENPNVRWTMVFTHKPMWIDKDLEKNGWGAMEKNLAGRNYTVFCGHLHRYQKYVRNGMNYYQLATTGGGSRLRGLQYGEFDQIAWITMKPEGPRIANIVLDGVLPEDLKVPDTNEPGVVRKKVPVFQTTGTVTLDGKPLLGATVSFHSLNKTTMKYAHVCDSLTDADGKYRMSTYTAFDGAPVGDYKVTVVFTGKGYYDGEVPEKTLIPAKYAKPETSGLNVTTKDSANDVKVELEGK